MQSTSLKIKKKKIQFLLPLNTLLKNHSRELVSIKMQLPEENKQNSTLLGALLSVVEIPVHNFSFYVYAEN